VVILQGNISGSSLYNFIFSTLSMPEPMEGQHKSSMQTKWDFFSSKFMTSTRLLTVNLVGKRWRWDGHASFINEWSFYKATFPARVFITSFFLWKSKFSPNMSIPAPPFTHKIYCVPFIEKQLILAMIKWKKCTLGVKHRPITNKSNMFCFLFYFMFYFIFLLLHSDILFWFRANQSLSLQCCVQLPMS
jgi:hypothetical protein